MSNSKTDRITEREKFGLQWQNRARSWAENGDYQRAYLALMFAYDFFKAAGNSTLAPLCKTEAQVYKSKAD